MGRNTTVIALVSAALVLCLRYTSAYSPEARKLLSNEYQCEAMAMWCDTSPSCNTWTCGGLTGNCCMRYIDHATLVCWRPDLGFSANVAWVSDTPNMGLRKVDRKRLSCAT